MPHTNNPGASKSSRKANRSNLNKPKFLQKKLRNKKQKLNPLEEGEAEPSLDDDLNLASTSTLPSNSNSKLIESTTTLPLPKIPRSAKAAIITEYHALEKQLAITKDPLERKLLLNRQIEIGGLEAYQEASIHGGEKSRGGESGKWCVQALKELKIGVEDKKGKAVAKVVPTIMADGTKVWPKIVREKIRILDVGAIAGTSYSDWESMIDATCIDLNPQAPHVAKFDFFDYPMPETQKEKFDVVGLSLVLNFVGGLAKRAEMLTHAHSYLRPSGLLYLVLPLPCLTNSRYMNHARLTSILTTLGYKVMKQFDSVKLTYWLLRSLGSEGGDGKIWKREEVRGGGRRNNFCILVGSSSGGAGENEEGGDEGEGDGEEEEWAPMEEEAEDDWLGCQ